MVSTGTEFPPRCGRSGQTASKEAGRNCGDESAGGNNSSKLRHSHYDKVKTTQLQCQHDRERVTTPKVRKGYHILFGATDIGFVAILMLLTDAC